MEARSTAGQAAGEPARLKATMKERLKQVYEEMRLQPVKQERPETGLPQNLP